MEYPTTWQSSQIAQEVLREVSLLVDATAGLYGYEVDGASETIVVVHRLHTDIEPAQAQIRESLAAIEQSIAAENTRVERSDLSDLTAAEQAAVRKDMVELNQTVLADVDVTVEFRSVCRQDAGDLEATEAAIASFGWADDSVPDEIEMAVQRDLLNGVIEVVVETKGPGTAQLERRLKEEFGDDVELVVDPDHGLFGEKQVKAKDNVAGRNFQAGRYADKSPHLGGVQLGDWKFRKGACTAGFAINMPNGGRAMLTAGHCKEFIPVDSYLYSGVFSRGESHNYYGVFYQSYWTDRDVGLIGSGSQKYRRKIYTEPDRSGASERLITIGLGTVGRRRGLHVRLVHRQHLRR